MFVFKVYASRGETLLAACDSDLVGKEIRDGDLRLQVLPGFYGTESAPREQIVAQLRRCTVANLVGEGVVGLAIELGYVEPSRVLWIGGVPHAQVARV